MTLRLNLLLITADQLRGDLLGCAGHPVAATPNLDALAREGTRFARHYSGAYPCGLARAGMVTGLYACAGANFVIHGVTDLIPALHAVEGRLARGERP